MSDMPTKSQIAKYWWDNYKTAPDVFVEDLGEPTCFACRFGFYGRYDHIGVRWESCWVKAPLERCHLTPKQFGGTNDASNLVLLCRDCHSEAPDVPDESLMLNWIVARENWFGRRCRELTEALKQFGVTNEMLEAAREEILADNGWMEKCGRHFGIGIKTSSIAAALVSHFNLRPSGAA